VHPANQGIEIYSQNNIQEMLRRYLPLYKRGRVSFFIKRKELTKLCRKIEETKPGGTNHAQKQQFPNPAPQKKRRNPKSMALPPVEYAIAGVNEEA
jgi:hypothetical protein